MPGLVKYIRSWGVLFLGLVVAHGPTTRLLECSCWDAHTHGPTPSPRVRFIPIPIKGKIQPNRYERPDFYDDSSDYP